MNRLSTYPALVSATLLIVCCCSLSCSSIKVEFDYDPEVDFSALHTYAWHDIEGPPEAGGPAPNSLLDRRIRTAVDETLAAKGYRPAPADSASFLVSHHIGVEQKLDVSTVHSGYGYGYGYRRRGWYGGYSETRVSEYDVGTLLLDILEPKGLDLIWRGSGQARVRESKTPEEREQRVREAVQKILAKFPPTP